MIQVVCDDCERTFEVRDEDAGTKVRCPLCGDVNLVPATVAAQAAAAIPDAASVATDDDVERELSVVRPAMFRAHPFRYALIVLGFVGGIVLAIASRSVETVPPWTIWPGGLLALVALGWFVKWWIAAHLWIRLSITNKRTVRHEGIIRRHSTEVLHDHVRSIDINQNFIQRILGVGYVGIDSAGQDGIEIEVRDIPGPYEVKKLIDRYRQM